MSIDTKINSSQIPGNSALSAAISQTDRVDQKEMVKLKKAAQDFEAIIIGQLLQGMRKSFPESGLFGSSAGSDIYAGMFDQNIAGAIAGKGALPLSDILIKGLTHKQESDDMGLTLSDYRLRTITKPVVKKRPPATIERDWDRSLIQEAAEKYNLDPRLVESVIKVESDYNANAVSHQGAVGLMQLMKGTADSLGVKNRFDARQNIFGGAKYLRDMLDRFRGNLSMALGAYNAGPSAVEKYRGVPPYKETERYVQKVLLNYRNM